MKTPHLLASLAVAVTVSAAVPKDPAEVAREWSRISEETRGLDLDPRKLSLPPGDRPTKSPVPFPHPHLNGDVIEVTPKTFPDQRMVLAAPNATPPKGAKPWYYRGQKYWLIPIVASETKESPGN